MAPKVQGSEQCTSQVSAKMGHQEIGRTESDAEHTPLICTICIYIYTQYNRTFYENTIQCNTILYHIIIQDMAICHDINRSYNIINYITI